MSIPMVVSVAPGSPAEKAGVLSGDQILTINGSTPRDVIEYQLLVDELSVVFELDSGGLRREVVIDREPGLPLGLEVDGALFDRVRTCDNHCEFCFIYQLPPGLRRNLYVKDDDYRLSFLYGNFTTLTRFTEADLERIVTEGLSPLYVSIHATDPMKRAEMLRNRRGATSLRWLRILLDHGVTVHGQVVLCPGVNDGHWLEDTLAGIADLYPELASLCVVPLGVSRYTTEPRMRAHTFDEAIAVLDSVEAWQKRFKKIIGRHLVYAADEYYLLAQREFPLAETYESFEMYEDGIGMARALEVEFFGGDTGRESSSGFFASIEGAPALGFRAPRIERESPVVFRGISSSMEEDNPELPITILTGELGAPVLIPILKRVGREDVRVLPIENRFFGGNIGVTGLIVGEDLIRVLDEEPDKHRYLLPDVCLSGGQFLDGTTPADLPRSVEIVATNGIALRHALSMKRSDSCCRL